jgi:hypothetical protein
MLKGSITGNFKDQMNQRAQRWIGKSIGARIHVPDDLDWWVFQEWGTATRGEFGGAAYAIDPVHAKMLAFPDSAGNTVFSRHVEHPGIPPRHPVLKVMPDIQAQAAQKINSALSEGGLDDPSNLQVAVTAAVTEARTQIAESMSKNIPGTRIDGKLLGETAASVFESQAVVIENGD